MIYSKIMVLSMSCVVLLYSSPSYIVSAFVGAPRAARSRGLNAAPERAVRVISRDSIGRRPHALMRWEEITDIERYVGALFDVCKCRMFSRYTLLKVNHKYLMCVFGGRIPLVI